MKGKKLTQQEAIDALVAVHNKKFDYSLVVYSTAQKKIDVICNTCKRKFSIEYNAHRKGQGCSICSRKIITKNQTKTNETFLKELECVTDKIVPLETYVTAKTKILCKCLICNYEWSISPNSLINQRSGCPFCSNRIKHTFDSLSEFVNKKHNGEIQLVKGQLIKGTGKKYMFRHSCGYEWYARASHITGGQSCPECSKAGYKPSKSGTFYILQVSGDQQFTGFGISNRYKTRLVEHNKNLKRSNCSILQGMLISSDGRTVQELERHIKETLQTNNSDIEGFKTESVLISKEELLDICLNWLTANAKLYNIKSITI